MVQFYFLSIVFNLIGGYALTVADRSRPFGFLKNLDETLGNSRSRLALGILSLVTGIFKLLTPMRGDVRVVGDLFPAVMQLSAALKSIEKLGLIGRMSIVGLAKQEESLFFPGDSEPLQLPYDNPAHLLIRRIRDEVHRFGITFHRQVRSKSAIKNDLEGIPGIGEKTSIELLKAFRSVKNIKTLTERELTRIAGASKARIIWNYFHSDEEAKEGVEGTE